MEKKSKLEIAVSYVTLIVAGLWALLGFEYNIRKDTSTKKRRNILWLPKSSKNAPRPTRTISGTRSSFLPCIPTAFWIRVPSSKYSAASMSSRN
jgi:hypothetical protein